MLKEFITIKYSLMDSHLDYYQVQ